MAIELMSFAQCPVCLSNQLEERHGVTVDGDEFGLPEARIHDAVVSICHECGAQSIGITNSAAVIRELRSNLVRADRALSGGEFAFLRRTLGATARRYAEVTGVHHTSISRIENAESVTTAQDALIRVLTLLDLTAGNALEHLAARDVTLIEAHASALASRAPTVEFEEDFAGGYVLASEVRVDLSIGRSMPRPSADARRRRVREVLGSSSREWHASTT